METTKSYHSIFTCRQSDEMPSEEGFTFNLKGDLLANVSEETMRVEAHKSRAIKFQTKLRKMKEWTVEAAQDLCIKEGYPNAVITVGIARSDKGTQRLTADEADKLDKYNTLVKALGKDKVDALLAEISNS